MALFTGYKLEWGTEAEGVGGARGLSEHGRVPDGRPTLRRRLARREAHLRQSDRTHGSTQTQGTAKSITVGGYSLRCQVPTSLMVCFHCPTSIPIPIPIKNGYNSNVQKCFH